MEPSWNWYRAIRREVSMPAVHDKESGAFTPEFVELGSFAPFRNVCWLNRHKQRVEPRLSFNNVPFRIIDTKDAQRVARRPVCA